MRIRAVFLSGVWLAAVSLPAAAVEPAPDGTGAGGTVDWAHGCLPFIAAAERHYGLPAGLLEAMALTESGQRGAPYPWALNIAGQPVAVRSYEEAAQRLRFNDGRPRRDVAVGCMQIHMQYHLDSFVDPEWALHPRYNVWYAALFLDRLHRRYGDWLAAIAHYHASESLAQRSYLCRVAAHLQHTGPATRQALGLGACPTSTPSAGWARGRLAETHRRLMAARRVGRIIVLGGDRE
jgi:hypothetical protein